MVKPLHHYQQSLEYHKFLFSVLYINDIINDLKLSRRSKLVLYANNILLYRTIHSADNYDSFSRILLNHLSFKCKSMVVSHKRLKAQLPALVLLSSPIDRVDSNDYLGLRIQCDLSWTDHIHNICSKARRLVGMLFRQFYHCAESSTIRTLYLSLIRSHLE